MALSSRRLCQAELSPRRDGASEQLCKWGSDCGLPFKQVHCVRQGNIVFVVLEIQRDRPGLMPKGAALHTEQIGNVPRRSWYWYEV